MKKLRAFLVATCISITALLLVAPASADTGTDALGLRLAFRHSGKCIDVPNGTASNVQLQQWSCHSGDNQGWFQEMVDTDPHGLNYYHIYNPVTLKCLTVPGNSLLNGAPVIQYPCVAGARNQHFAMIRIPQIPEPYRLFQARHSQKYLAIHGASTANGAKLIQWSFCDICPAEHIKWTSVAPDVSAGSTAS